MFEFFHNKFLSEKKTKTKRNNQILSFGLMLPTGKCGHREVSELTETIWSGAEELGEH